MIFKSYLLFYLSYSIYNWIFYPLLLCLSFNELVVMWKVARIILKRRSSSFSNMTLTLCRDTLLHAIMISIYCWWSSASIPAKPGICHIFLCSVVTLIAVGFFQGKHILLSVYTFPLPFRNGFSSGWSNSITESSTLFVSPFHIVIQNVLVYHRNVGITCIWLEHETFVWWKPLQNNIWNNFQIFLSHI